MCGLSDLLGSVSNTLTNPLTTTWQCPDNHPQLSCIPVASTTWKSTSQFFQNNLKVKFHIQYSTFTKQMHFSFCVNCGKWNIGDSVHLSLSHRHWIVHSKWQHTCNILPKTDSHIVMNHCACTTIVRQSILQPCCCVVV